MPAGSGCSRCLRSSVHRAGNLRSPPSCRALPRVTVRTGIKARTSQHAQQRARRGQPHGHRPVPARRHQLRPAHSAQCRTRAAAPADVEVHFGDGLRVVLEHGRAGEVAAAPQPHVPIPAPSRQHLNTDARFCMHSRTVWGAGCAAAAAKSQDRWPCSVAVTAPRRTSTTYPIPSPHAA